MNPRRSHVYFIPVPAAWTSTEKSDQKEHKYNEGVISNTCNPFLNTPLLGKSLVLYCNIPTQQTECLRPFLNPTSGEIYICLEKSGRWRGDDYCNIINHIPYKSMVLPRFFLESPITPRRLQHNPFHSMSTIT